MPESSHPDDALRIGRDHLAAAEWVQARRAFGDAAAASETPAAWEGLSWAAWWLDDANTVFDARERAYRLFRQEGDLVGAARMAIWLACDSVDFRGATRVAGGWLHRAHHLLDGLSEEPEHGWLAFHEGFLASGSGDTTTAFRLAERTRDIGRRCDAPDLEMLGLAFLGRCLVSTGRVDDGMRCLDEAQVMTVEATLPIAAAWTSCFLVSSCIAVLDLQRAFQWCDAIERFAERYGSRYMLAFCRAEYGVIHVWRGQWADGEKTLEAAVADFVHSRPAMAGAPLAALAELRLRQGRSEDASALLEQAGVSAATLESRARLALDRGQCGRARELAERALRHCPRERVVDRITLLATLARCRLACGDEAAAHEALVELREVGALVSGEAVRAFVRETAGACAAAAGRYDPARLCFEDAVDGFQRAEAPYEAALARLELATSLLALGRADAAAQEAAAARQTFDALGAMAAAARAGRLILAVDGQAHEPGTGLPVTRRERDVLGLLVDGLTNRQIADRLVVSEHTVHRHVTNILRKLDLPSRTAAAAFAVRAGLVTAKK